MQGSLRDKTARGVGWSFIDNIANSGITFLVGLVLARLLTPEEQSFHKPDKQEKLLTVIVKEEAGKRTI